MCAITFQLASTQSFHIMIRVSSASTQTGHEVQNLQQEDEQNIAAI